MIQESFTIFEITNRMLVRRTEDATFPLNLDSCLDRIIVLVKIYHIVRTVILLATLTIDPKQWNGQSVSSVMTGLFIMTVAGICNVSRVFSDIGNIDLIVFLLGANLIRIKC